MGNFLYEFWYKIVNLGIHESLEETDKIKVRLANKLLATAIVIPTILVTVKLFLGIGSPIVSVGTIAIASFAWLFQYLRRYQFTRLLICFLYPTYIAYLFNAVERNIAQVNALLIVVLMIVILYDDRPRLKVIAVLYVFSIGIGCHILNIIEPHQFSFGESYSNHVSIFVSALIILGVIIYFYQQDLHEYEDANSLLVNNLESKSEELERFAYVTSHDLKEPVRNIGSLAELLESGFDNPENIKKNKEMIDLIEVSSTRMSSLIGSIIDFSKIDAEDFFSEEISTAELVEEIKISHNELISDRSAKIVYANMPIVHGNKVFMSLLFQNLISNSITYNDSAEPTVSVTGELKTNTVELIVSDNGIGIDKEFHDYIFEPFKKLNSDLMFQGSGLGLSICKKIVEYHRGTISVTSSQGDGTKFFINLPISRT